MKVLLIYFPLMISQLASALKCNFRYNEIDKNSQEHVVGDLVEKSLQNHINNANINAMPFECDDDESLSTRFGVKEDDVVKMMDDIVDEESLCETRTKTIRPKSLPLTSNNQLVTIVNHQEFIQTVTIEECTNSNKACEFHQNFPLGYTTKCKQKYQTHTIKAIDPEKASIYDAKVYFPSGCECKIYSGMRRNIRSRFRFRK